MQRAPPLDALLDSPAVRCALSRLGLLYGKSICSRLIKHCIDFLSSEVHLKRLYSRSPFSELVEHFPFANVLLRTLSGFSHPNIFPPPLPPPSPLGIKSNFLPFWKDGHGKKRGREFCWFSGHVDVTLHDLCALAVLLVGFHLCILWKYLAGVLFLLIS